MKPVVWNSAVRSGCVALALAGIAVATPAFAIDANSAFAKLFAPGTNFASIPDSVALGFVNQVAASASLPAATNLSSSILNQPFLASFSSTRQTLAILSSSNGNQINFVITISSTGTLSVSTTSGTCLLASCN